MLVARRYVVTGRVQGVGFRFFTEDAARREGLSGFVRNQPGGGVEVVVEGELEAMDRFDTAVRQGPRGARVDRVDFESLPPSGRLTGFVIR